jgi:hypothetical protein
MPFKKKKRKKSKSTKKNKKFFDIEDKEIESAAKKNAFMNEDDINQVSPITKNKNKGIEEDQMNENENNKRLNKLANLTYPWYKFIGKNILERHIVISPIIKVSIFHPRWKKLTMLVTEICIMSIMSSILLTADEKITDKTMGGCVKVAFISMLCANVSIYILAFFFNFSNNQIKKLNNLVQQSGQLIILKEWEEMTCRNAGFTFLGLVIHYGIWAFAFYISIAFVAVWKAQAKAYLISMIWCFCFDFILFEIVVEMVIALLYIGRDRNELIRKITDFLYRSRNYRCLWP